ncbi:MAG: electron transfer flavoprotein subunit alpha/FixB family protein [Gracilibacteraceae bacterium]|jgi:electron transfer flavoprotein alpha subunit|nr:electron transfer flavoprotein subunit alpha/FixB family protein [Gracilibacteraceae bacterium]
MKTWIILTDERRAGGMLATARALGGEVAACAAGARALADAAVALGFDKVIHFDLPADAPAEACAAALGARAAADAPDVVLASDAPPARILLGAVSAVIEAAVVASARGLALREGRITVARATAEGKILEDLEIDGKLAAIYDGDDQDVQPASPPPPNAAPPPPVRAETVPVAAGELKVMETLAGAEGAGLLTAPKVVGVGLGLGSKANLPLIEELAAALRAEIACTLPVCNDMRWLGEHHVVGSSHSQIAPDLYIAAGVSGAPNHLSGARDAKITVAINNDPEARIFKFCDYGVVGDLTEIVPALTAALK